MLTLARRSTVAFAVLLIACSRRSDPGPAPACDVFQDASCLDAARMKADVDELASAPYAGRRAGTPGNDKAVALAEGRFVRDGLATPPGMTSHLQPFAFDHWEPTAASLALGGTPVQLGSGFEVIYDSASATLDDRELVFAGYGITMLPWDPAAHPEYAGCPISPATGYDDYASVDVTGKIVVILRGTPGGRDVSGCQPDLVMGYTAGSYRQTFYKVKNAWYHGAAGVLFVQPYTVAAGAPTPFTNVLWSNLPSLFVDRATLETFLPSPGLYAWATGIDASLAPASHATGKTASMTVAGETRTFSPANVLGVVPGTDPALKDQVVVVGGHVDHMGELPLRTEFFPGADDNASGAAVVLELARAVAASPTKPKRTILFAIWNAEEFVMTGSCYYVNQDHRFPLASTVAAFSVDMVGAGSPGLELWGAQDFPWIAALADANAAALGLGAIVAQPALTGSDHACFLYPDVGPGIPGFLASTPTILEHPTYHTVNDVAAGVPAENLGAAARLLWASVRGLANGESPWTSTAALTARRGSSRPPSGAERIAPGFSRE